MSDCPDHVVVLVEGEGVPLRVCGEQKIPEDTSPGTVDSTRRVPAKLTSACLR